MRALSVLLPLLALAAVTARAAPADYPTEALARYVLECTAVNGYSPDSLRRCSCSIDEIAKRLSYDEFVEAETILAVRNVPSGRDQVALYRSSPWAQEIVDKLRQAQVEADLKCF